MKPLLLFLLLLGKAWALQLEVPMAELFGRSTLVVVAEVTSHECRWAPGPEGRIESEYWLATASTLRGSVGDTLSLHIDGGTVGDIATWTEHEPRLFEDRRYLLFLTTDQSGRWRVLGGERGAIELKSDLSPNAPALSDIITEISP